MNQPGANSTPVDARAYEPPTLFVLGSVETITRGGHGSFADHTGLAKKNR